ncbi:MAG TPA: SprB repeat-containing protein, partial [Flavobacteriales bacterium]|nr:SprB repeat-containing protein [Flavobacteriales bacterium]
PACSGTASATITGGTGPFIVSWTLNGTVVSTDPDATALCGGLYQINVSDVNGCSVQQVVQVSDSNAEVLTPTDGQTTCANNCDGTVSVSFVCNSPPCNLQWTDAQGNVIAQNQFSVGNLCVGTYTAEVTNASGCVSFADADVSPSQTLIPNLSTTPASCAGVCDGSATVGPTGGLAPYDIVWNPGGQVTPQITAQCAGAYTVSITDALSCDTTLNVLIIEPPAITIDGTVQDLSCNQSCDGAITAIVSGGTQPYLFLWSPVPPVGQGTLAVSQLCAGDWTLTVTDANGCSFFHTFNVGEPQALSMSFTTSDSHCGVCDGTGDVVATGGTTPYVITWNLNGSLIATGPNATGLCAGLYQVLLTDANLCSLQMAVAISDADGESITVTDDVVTCPGDCDGVVNAVFNCSAPLCSTAWFDAFGTDLNESSNTLDSLCAGTYLVQVTNGNGCITIEPTTVTQPQPIAPNLSTTPVSCFGACDGTATVGPTGGQPPYSYLWTPAPPNGQGTPQATGLCAGNWSVLIGDSAGCSITQNIIITEPTLLIASGVVTPITCNGACDGSIALAPSGGTGPYTFTWTPVPANGQGNADATGLCANTWVVVVADAHGCDTTLTFIVNDPPVLDAQVATTNNACFGDCNGTAIATITGGTPGYTIAWSDAGGTVIAQNVDSVGGLCAGDYSVLVTDTNGCSVTVPITITEGAQITAQLLSTNETCFGPCDGTASVAPGGGTGSFTFLWQPAPATGQGTNAVTGLCAGPNTVTITDSLGCDTVISFNILPYTPITDNAAVTNVNCHGACDGSVVLSASGGFGFFTYNWSYSSRLEDYFLP